MGWIEPEGPFALPPKNGLNNIKISAISRFDRQYLRKARIYRQTENSVANYDHEFKLRKLVLIIWTKARPMIIGE